MFRLIVAMATTATGLAAGAQIAAADGIGLSLPVACELGRTCFIQQYMDVGGPEGPRDYRCGSATYKGHTGLDIRVPSAGAAQRTPVAVIAAASGRVLRVRDGVADIFAREAGPEAVRPIGCGNAVVLAHGHGWETVYCHLRRGTVAVKPGDAVMTGQRLGDVGWSGLADMAHVHFQVMKDGKVVDPFTGKAADGTCQFGEAADGSLWTEPARRTLVYQQGQILTLGFAARQVSPEDLEREHVPQPVSVHSPAIVFFARLINVRAGDEIVIQLVDPEGAMIGPHRATVTRNQATAIHMVGRTANEKPVAAGTWRGSAALVRQGVVLWRESASRDVR